MNSHLKTSLRTRTNPRRRGHLLTLTASVIIVVVFVVFTKPSIISETFLWIGQPVKNFFSSISGNGFGSETIFSSKARLWAENQELKGKLVEQSVAILQLESLTKENEQLRSEFGRTNRKKTLQASVLAAPGISPYDTFLVDVGESEGVRLGARAYFFEGLAAGRVTRVDSHTALITLLSSPEEIVPVVVGSRNSLLQAKGRGGGEFVLEIPKDIQLSEEQPVFLPGTPQQVLGKIESVQTDIAHSVQTVYFRTLLNLSEVRSVFIER